MKELNFPLFQGRMPAIIKVSALAACLGFGILWATKTLEMKWLVALVAAFSFLGFAVATGRFERFLLNVFFFLIPLNADFNWHSAGSSGGGVLELGVSTLDLLMVFLYGAWILRLVSRREPEPGPALSAALPLVLLVAWSGLSMINARQPELTLYALVGLLKTLFYFFYFAHNIKTREDLWMIVRCLALGLIVESLITFLQYAAGGYLGLDVLGERQIPKELELSMNKVVRVGGTLGHPNQLGGYLSAVLPLMFCVNGAKLGRGMRFLVTLAIGLGMIVLILTFSRSAWLATALAFIVMLGWLVTEGRIHFRLGPVLMGGLALITIFLFFKPLIMARVTEDDEGSVTSRFAQMRVARSMITQHPVLGVGLNNYDAVKHLNESFVENSMERGKVNRVHNIFLLLAAETGLVGLGLFVWFLWSLAVLGLKKISSIRDGALHLIFMGLYLCFFARILHDATHTAYLSTSPLFWIYSALLVSNRKWDTAQ